MYTKEQVESILRQEAKNKMFDRDFQLAVNKYIQEKKDNAGKTYAEKVNWEDYKVKQVY